MSKTRLEAFSDGVLAIIITIMVLELRVPHGSDLAALAPLASLRWIGATEPLWGGGGPIGGPARGAPEGEEECP